jgi:hypothetical protein
MKTPNADKIAKLQKEIDELQKVDALFLAMTDEEKLAEALHTLLCRWNHTDGCGWHYEIRGGQHDWAGSSHGPYLTKARGVMAFCKSHRLNPNEALDFVKMVQM